MVRLTEIFCCLYGVCLFVGNSDGNANNTFVCKLRMKFLAEIFYCLLSISVNDTNQADDFAENPFSDLPNPVES